MALRGKASTGVPKGMVRESGGPSLHSFSGKGSALILTSWALFYISEDISLVSSLSRFHLLNRYSSSVAFNSVVTKPGESAISRDY